MVKFSAMLTGKPYFKKFRSFAEAEAWDDEHYAAMSPRERLALVFELVDHAARYFPHAFETEDPGLDPRVPRVRRVAE